MTEPDLTSRLQPHETLAQSLQRRLRQGLAAWAVLLAGLLVLGLLAFRTVNLSYSQALDETARSQDLVAGLGDGLVGQVLHTRAYLLTGDETSLTSRALAQADFERALGELQAPGAPLPAGAALALEKLRDLQAQYTTLTDEMIALRRDGDTAGAVALFDQQSDPLVLQMLETRRTLRQQLQQAVLDANRAYSQRTLLVLGLLAAAWLAGLAAAAWAQSRGVGPSLTALDYFEHSLVETARGQGLHPVRLPATLPGEHRGLFEAYNGLAQQLRDSQAERYRFVARMAHDLRSPLAAITGYAGLLEGGEAADGAQRQHYARVIGQQAERLDRLVGHLATVASIEEQQLELTVAPLHLAPLLASLTCEAAEAQAHPVDFAADTADDLVTGDALRLREVFLDLLDNALRFSPPAAPVRVTLRGAAQPGWVEVTMQDQGPGIAPEDRPRLFQRFGRIYTPGTQAEVGSGLGLYIARHLVEQHGGRLELESSLGQGTRVRVRLPLDQPGRAAAGPGEGAP